LPRVIRGRRYSMALLTFPDLASLVGRLALGAIFLAHGWPKMKDLQKTIGFVKGTGWPGGATFAVLFSLLEFFGAIALILGLLTQFVASASSPTWLMSRRAAGKSLNFQVRVIAFPSRDHRGISFSRSAISASARRVRRAITIRPAMPPSGKRTWRLPVNLV